MAEAQPGSLNGQFEDQPPASAGNGEAGHDAAVAQYLADMIGQLEVMARTAGLDLLVYLLSMAQAEAETSARAGRNRFHIPE